MLSNVITNKVCFKWTVETGVDDKKRAYEGLFYLDNDTPTEVVKEMLFQYGKYVGQIEDMVKEQQKKADAEKEKASLITEDSEKVEQIPQE